MNNKKQSPPTALYYVGLTTYILIYMSYETQWEYPGIIVTLMKCLAITSLAFHLMINLNRFRGIKMLLTLVIALFVSLVAGYNASFLKTDTLLFPSIITFLLVFGAKGIDMKKILKIYLLVGGGYCIITVIASLLGIIENVADFSDREVEDNIGTFHDMERMCFGYGWSTNMANHVLFLILCYYYYINRSFNKKELLLFFTIALLILNYTGTRLSFFCFMLLLLVSMLQKVRKWQTFVFSWVFKSLFIVSIPLFAYISFYTAYVYDESDLMWLGANLVLSGRLGLGNLALTTAGIPLFGQQYLMYGSVRDDGAAYNYVDSSYLQLLVIYGLVYTIMIMLAYIYMCKKASLQRDYNLTFFILIAGATGLIAQHFIEIYMNPLLITLFANTGTKRFSNKRNSKKSSFYEINKCRQ